MVQKQDEFMAVFRQHFGLNPPPPNPFEEKQIILPLSNFDEMKAFDKILESDEDFRQRAVSKLMII